MSPEEGFLDALLDAPRDDTPRLVYADWLEEFGSPRDRARAELLRLQSAWFKTRARNRLQRKQLAKRERDLLAQNKGLAGALERLQVPSLLGWEVALPAFLYAQASQTPARADPLVAGSVWRGQLHQDPYAFPTKLTILERTGTRFTGRMHEDFQSQDLQPTYRRFSVEGVVVAGRLAVFVPGHIAGPTATPSLYQLWRDGDTLTGTWEFPPTRKGRLVLHRSPT
jgi:uncharacterized protein (TIGR02996 family)